MKAWKDAGVLGQKGQDSCSRQAVATGDPEDRLASCYLCFYQPGARVALPGVRLVVAEGGCCAGREACVVLSSVDKSHRCCLSCFIFYKCDA